MAIKLTKSQMDILQALHEALGQIVGTGPKSPPKVAETAPKAKPKPTAKAAAKRKAQPSPKDDALTPKQQKVADHLTETGYDAATLRAVCGYLEIDGVTPRQRTAKSIDVLARNATIKQIKEAVNEFGD